MDRTVLLLMLCLQAFLLTTTFTSADASTPLKYKQSSDLVNVEKRTSENRDTDSAEPGEYAFPVEGTIMLTRERREDKTQTEKQNKRPHCSELRGGCGPMEKVNVEKRTRRKRYYCCRLCPLPGQYGPVSVEKRTSENRDTDSTEPGEYAFPVEGTIMLTRERREDKTQKKKKRSYVDCSEKSGACTPMEKVSVEKRTWPYCCRLCPLPGQYGPVNVEKRTSENRDTDSTEPGDYAFPVEGTIMLTRERREDKTQTEEKNEPRRCSKLQGGCGPMEKVSVEKRTSEKRVTDSAKPGQYAFPLSVEKRTSEKRVTDSAKPGQYGPVFSWLT